MIRLSVEQVFALAPDAGALSSAVDLAKPSKWESSGVNDIALWGEARGSGKVLYDTAVDLKNLAYKCTCPSRKVPCKHSLGLLLRHAKGEIAEEPIPIWVAEWLDKRVERAARQAENASSAKSAADPQAADKRAEKRWQNILAGLEECDAFLADAVSQGLLANQSSRTWDMMAARMIDAQAPGVASRLRRIGATIGVGEAWAASATGQLGNLRLLIEAAGRIDSLGSAMGSDVRSALGISTRKEDLDSQTVVDVWDVVGQIKETEERLTTCRSWLRSRSDGRWGMHLAFSAAGQPFEFRPIPGTAVAASVRFYPSAWPHRIHFGEFEIVAFQAAGGGTWGEALEAATSIWSANPWVEQVPVHLHNSVLGREVHDWYAIDQAGKAMPLTGSEPWEVLALGGNQPCELFGEWDGVDLRLLGAWGNWGYVSL